MKRHDDRARAAQRKRFARLEVEILEPRNLPSTFTNAVPNYGSLVAGPDALTNLPIGTSPAIAAGSTASASSSTSGPAAAASGIPALSSLPGARDSIWLNFGGDFVASWGSYSNITVPMFGDGTSFTSAQIQQMQQIWQVVAEKYAPFNINVTTVQPSNTGHGYTQKVDIGGNGSWTGGTYGGLTYIGSFSGGGLPNISFVFPDNLGGGNPTYTGDAAAHEAGHGFGLYHQSTWSGSTLTNEYNPGTSAAGPIMGNPYYDTQALWWDGTSDQGPTVIQDDMSIIASATNGFGYRPEPSDTSTGTASPLTVSGNQVSASGIIIYNTDKDYYSFTTGGGQITLSANVGFGNDLTPTITLLGSNGQTVLASNDPSPNFTATVTANLSAGTYYVVVGSHGGYDDVGQYTISGTIVPTSTGTPNAPTGLTATAGTGQVSLSWNTVSGATGYSIYRGTTSGGEGSTAIATVTGTAYTDTGLNNGTTYYYVIRATNSAGSSGNSNEASAIPYSNVSSGQNTSIDAGGGATGSFVTDTDFSGGGTYSTTAAINTSKVTNPAPQAVYQTERYGNFNYVVGNLTPGSSYTVRLDFAELYWNSAGQRLFNVSINGQQVLTKFDIYATAGGQDIAVAENFTATANASGQIVIAFTSVKDNAKVDGIEITSTSSTTPPPPPPTTGGGVSIDAGGGATGSFVADTEFSSGGTYSTTAAINTSKVSNPAPQSVYQTERYGNFTYTVPNLTAGSSYTVRLDFAELYWNSAGQRLFNVSINGQQVLNNFDIYATAGGQDIAVAENFTATANASGQIVIAFTSVKDNAKVDGIEITPTSSQPPPPPSGGVNIDAGGAATGSFVSDTDFSGGGTYSTTAAINTSKVSNPAPQSVYQTERYGNFTYTVPNLTAGASYTVRLDFAELYWTSAGQRLFNVAINGQQVLTNFDIYATAGGQDIAVAENFTATANSSGQIVIQFTTVKDNAKVDGIEITPVSGAPAASPTVSPAGAPPSSPVAALNSLLGATAPTLQQLDAFFAQRKNWGQ